MASDYIYKEKKNTRMEHRWGKKTRLLIYTYKE